MFNRPKVCVILEKYVLEIYRAMPMVSAMILCAPKFVRRVDFMLNILITKNKRTQGVGRGGRGRSTQGNIGRQWIWLLA